MTSLSDDRLSRATGTFDFVNTHIVLQHIPVHRGMAILGELLARVNPGGGCAIHLSIRRRQNRFRRAIYWVRHNVPGAQAFFNLIHGRRIDTPEMQMNEYPLPDVIRMFQSMGFGDLVMSYQDHGDNDTVLITARRQTA